MLKNQITHIKVEGLARHAMEDLRKSFGYRVSLNKRGPSKWIVNFHQILPLDIGKNEKADRIEKWGSDIPVWSRMYIDGFGLHLSWKTNWTYPMAIITEITYLCDLWLKTRRGKTMITLEVSTSDFTHYKKLTNYEFDESTAGLPSIPF